MKNQITSFSELEGYLSELESLSSEIQSELSSLQSVFETQSEGWASANSSREIEKMDNFVEKGKIISNNIQTIKAAVAEFKTATQEADAL